MTRMDGRKQTKSRDFYINSNILQKRSNVHLTIKNQQKLYSKYNCIRMKMEKYAKFLQNCKKHSARMEVVKFPRFLTIFDHF